MSALNSNPRARIAEAADALPSVIDDMMARSGVPGISFAMVHEGSTVVDGGIGLRSLADSAAKPVDADTVFQLASVSKPIAATVIAALVARGELNWDSRIVDIMPELDLGEEYVNREVTIGDLLAHRSGLPHAAGDDLEDIGFCWPEILNRIGMLDSHSFRSRHAYSNFGFTAAAQAASRLSGSSWEELAHREVFGPLTMKTASYRHADFIAQKNRASLHASKAGKWVAAFDRDPDQQAPAGGASASVRDLARWMLLLLGRGTFGNVRLFDEPDIMPALTPQAMSGPPITMGSNARQYGFGFNISAGDSGRVSYGHSGGFLLGAGTTFRIIPDLDFGIAVLTNAAPMGVAESIAATIMDLVEFGEVTRDWYSLYFDLLAPLHSAAGDLLGGVATPAGVMKDFTEYVGDYEDEYFGPARVIESNPHELSVLLGPEFGYRLDLIPWSTDVFAFVPHGESATDGSLSSLQFGRDGGRITRMHLEFFGSNGRGTWKR